MKKEYILITFLLIIGSVLSAEIPVKGKVTTYNATLSLGIASGGSVGIGKIQHFEQTTKEITANFHYLMNSDYLVTGIYGQINSYRNKCRKGFFTLLIAGVDYTAGKEYQNPIFGNPGGPDEGDSDKVKFEGIFPNIAIGCGYSIQLSQKNKMQVYLDLGIKKTIANLNVAITF